MLILFSRYPVIAPVSLSIALLITSCSETKTSQCQRLVTVVNQGTSLIDIKKGQQASTSLQLSKDLKNVTKSIQELNLKDPKLQEFETKFIKIFDHLSEAIAKASQALADTKKAEASSDGRVKVEKARREIDSALTTAAKTAGKESDTLGVQLNKYCSQAEATKN
ncbi:MAG: hypothetical protein HEQ27_09750 [Dolichospermum sp. JUN01]|nr:hypothetical protein [Dolichospermum sp. JUN01]